MITGASGFIGRHVVGELKRKGVAPTVALRPGSPVPPWLAKLEAVPLNISAPQANPFDALGRPDVLMHLAWGGLPNYQSAHHLTAELPNHSRFLSEMVEGGLDTLLVVGTCLEYGMQSGPLNESLHPQPTNPYAEAKDLLRRQLEQASSRRQCHLTWARLFYVYGEGQNAGSLFPQLMRAVAEGKDAFDMSGGEQLRDFLPASLAARLLVHLALAQQSFGTVNVCSGRPVSVRAMVQRWIDENGWSIRPNLGRYPYPDYEPMAFWGDTTKLEHCMGSQ